MKSKKIYFYLGFLALVLIVNIVLMRGKIFNNSSTTFYEFEGRTDEEIVHHPSKGYLMKCGTKDCGFLKTDCAPYVLKLDWGDRIYKQKNTMEFLLIKANGKRHECEAI